MKLFRIPRGSRRFLAPALLASMLASNPLRAADWPQWRGPERDGISQETGLLKEWPSQGPKLAWQITDAGGGYSTPAVVGDRFYLLGNKGTEDEYVAARETKNGDPVWSTSLGKVGNPHQHPSYPGARSTPTVDGDSIYALSSDGDLACLSLANGKIVWQKSLRKDFDGQPGQWAYAESPLVDGDALVCTPGGATATVVALNKKSGDVIWKCAVPGGDEAAYSSIIISHATGVKQYVQFLQKGVVGIDAATGKFLWRYEKTASGSMANIPTPLAVDNSVYSAAGKSGGGLVKLKSDEGKIDTDQAYFSPKLPTSIGGVVKVGEFMYGTNSAALMCVNFATGDIKWTNRSIGAISIVYAEGRLYLHGEKGDVALVEATPDAYHELGRFTPPKRPKAATPKPGPTRSSPTASCTSANWIACGATTFAGPVAPRRHDRKPSSFFRWCCKPAEICGSIELASNSVSRSHMLNLSNGIDSLTNFKRQTSEYIERLRETGEPMVLTVNGKAEVVVQDADAYQKLVEAAGRAELEETVAAIRAGLEDVAAGRTKPARAALKALAKKYGMRLPGK